MCDYFILTKQKGYAIGDDSKNQIICLSENVHILPKNRLPYYISGGLCEKYLIDWCKQYCSKDKNILDIGAHTGTYSITLSEYCNKVYAFEPQRMSYYSLCGGVALSNIKNIFCLNIGLGTREQVGIQTLNIISLDGGGSTLHNNNVEPILDTEEIEIKTLDSLNLENISFIKMDVENNEHQVLLGSIQTLERSNYPTILFEMNKVNYELTRFLETNNYNVIKLQNIENMFLAVKK